MTKHEEYIQAIKRYLRDRERELLVKLQGAYAKPKEALIVGTQLKEIQETVQALQEIQCEVLK